MKVQELIDKLASMNPEAEVAYIDWDTPENPISVTEVQHGFRNAKRRFIKSTQKAAISKTKSKTPIVVIL